ncbi:MAG TPA: hypothetical protein VHE55_08980 [Fimbriimonadaceae bacterium]|nr:hypothetical protein [Fimbriimonadaceae bacterium]
MRLRLLLPLLLVTLAWGQDYKTDARLQKPISARLTIAAFSTMAETLSKATGVPITVATNLKDRKITLIFKDRPASEAMEKIAETFRGDWKASSGGYLFELPREEVSQEIAMIGAEDVAMRNVLDADIARMAAVARLAPDLVQERQREVASEIKKIGTPKTEEDTKRLAKLNEELTMLAMNNWREVGIALKSASQNQIARLKDGETIFASTKGGGLLPFSADPLSGVLITTEIKNPDGTTRSEGHPPTDAVGAMRYNETGGCFEVAEIALGFGPGGAACLPKSLDLLYSREVYEATKDKPLRKEMVDWAKADDPAVLKKPIVPPATRPPSSPYFSKLLSMADHLAYLADNAGIPVVADAFRTPVTYDSYPFAKDVDGYFQGLYQSPFLQVGIGYRRTEGGWLMYRHTRFWRQQEREVPEAWLAPLEAKRQWTLDDYAGLAARLNPKQAYNLRKRMVLVRFPRMPLTEAMPALQLWASLTETQREKAYTGGLMPGAMSADQLALYTSGLQELMWNGTLNETFLPPLIKGELPPGMAFFMRDANNDAPVIISGYQEVQIPPNQSFSWNYGTENSKDQIDSRISFLFGTSPERAASYNFSLIPRSK